jgi:hypothetical protein
LKRKFRRLSRLNWRLRRVSDSGDRPGAMPVMWMIGVWDVSVKPYSVLS